MRPLVIFRDPSSVPTYGIKLTDAGYAVDLLPLTDTELTVPAGARIAVFGTSNTAADIWVSDSAITLPSTNAFVPNNAMQNPPPLVVHDGDYTIATLHFMCAIATTLQVSFYR